MLLTLLSIFIIFNRVLGVDYCSDALKCQGNPNSACNCDFGKGCKNQKVHETTDDFRMKILDAHNNYRERVASGKENQGGLSFAGDMHMLLWDSELEHVATCWNKQCQFSHDTCRATEKFPSAGQNLYWSSGQACDWDSDLKGAIDGWYGEVKDMTPSCIQAYGRGCVTSNVGHFSQLIWAKTTHVGCSLIEYNGQCQIACNYGPAGNFLGEPIFTKGTPQCKFLSKVYNHLCLLSEDDDSNKLIKRHSVNGGEPQNKLYFIYFIIIFVIFVI